MHLYVVDGVMKQVVNQRRISSRLYVALADACGDSGGDTRQHDFTFMSACLVLCNFRSDIPE